MSQAMLPAEWRNVDGELTQQVVDATQRALRSYLANPRLVDEHANLERSIAQGGYGRRQIYELIQNGADALLDTTQGRIHVILTKDALYCANEGAPINRDGIEALLHAHLSVKRNMEIGRFGLGFKSVLGITTRPEFYSRAASFGFDAAWSRDEISRVSGGHPHYPTLRLARVLRPSEAAATDPVLAELLGWATTVVRVPRDAKSSDWLDEDIKSFPAEFMLFSSHVSTLTLEDRQRGFIRVITIDSASDEISIRDGGELSTWKVFRTSHRPSPGARAEAGELANREVVPVVWAVPTSGRKRVGSFWAFFPLADETTLSGIVNAPWKTNDDRTTLMKGVFNAELLHVVAELVVANVGNLQTDEDPAKYLDALPARGREARCWADGLLTEGTYAAAKRRPILPDQTGTLRCVSQIHVHPDGVPQEVLRLWSEHADRPDDWCHASAETRERAARVERLLKQENHAAEELNTWFEALVKSQEYEAFRGAIKIAARLAGMKLEFLEQVRECYVVVTHDDQIMQARPDGVFFPRDLPVRSRHVLLVHDELADDPATRAALTTIGIVEVDPARVLQALVDEVNFRWVARDWREFWEVVRITPKSKAVEILRASRDERDYPFQVRTLSGEWRPLNEALLPGLVVPADGSRDTEVCIDKRFHEEELDVLGDLGAVSVPTAGHGRRADPTVREYRELCKREYLKALKGRSSRPNQEYLDFENPSIPGPLEPLKHLSTQGRAAFCKALLDAAPATKPWVLKHTTQEKYPAVECPSIEYWLIGTSGRLPTTLGPRAVKDCVGPALAPFAPALPVAEIDELHASGLGLPDSFDKLRPALVRSGLDACRALKDDAVIGPFYADAAYHGFECPEEIRCRTDGAWGFERPGSVVVSTEPGAVRILVEQGTPVLRVQTPSEAQWLVSRWGLRSSSDAVRTQVVPVESESPAPILDMFPALELIAEERLRHVSIAACSEIRREVLTERGKRTTDIPYAFKDDTLYWQDTQTHAEVLHHVDAHFGIGLSPEQVDGVLEQRDRQEKRNRIAEIRRKPSNAARLVAAIGVDAIRRRLPSGLIDTVAQLSGDPSHEQIGQLALAVYGVGVLRQFRDELADAGFGPPHQWAGSPKAQAFVRKLGFGREFAGFEGARRDPVRTVDGPLELPPLHDFQDAIVSRVRELLHAPPKERRGLLSLPTGAGKTRVAVQALTDAIREGDLSGPILWVAQSDELCEQAVHSWAQVWRSCGSQGLLHISRLWSQNEAQLQPDGANVVVATIQKLRECIGKPNYGWLEAAACVVIDEAHGATTPSYTRLLTWQRIGRPGTAARCPLVGLTATPFRGHNELETKRLVGRFGSRRLDVDLGDDPYAVLQDKTVLAEVDHKILEGAQIALDRSELDELESLRKVPSSVSDRIAADGERNQILLRSLTSLSSDWPVLVFAASVQHAQTLAALLTMEGKTAASIDASTEQGARRHYVEAFRAGDLQILTNYGVLTQGFDAPAVRAIYVARPTFSPNVYQQMIGRGLRGPLNGGKERCLIVNVRDNFEQFGERLAFQEFEHLWRRDVD